MAPHAFLALSVLSLHFISRFERKRETLFQLMIIRALNYLAPIRRDTITIIRNV